MTMNKFLSHTSLLLFGLLVSTVTADDVENVIDKLSQRRRDLEERGPMSSNDAKFMRKLITDKTLSIVDDFSSLKGEPVAQSNNPFAKALLKEQYSDRRLSRGGRRAQPRGTSSQRGLGAKKEGGGGSNKGGSNKGGSE